MAIAPVFIYHRLDRARVYRETKRVKDARARLTKLATLPLAGLRDAEYQARAKTMLAELPAE